MTPERTARLANYTFFTRDVDQYKNTSLSQLYQPPRTPFSQNTLSLATFVLWILQSFKNSFFTEDLHLQMFFETSVLKSFPNFTWKHLCWSLFLKILQAESLFLLKKSSTQVFSCEVCEIFKNIFPLFYRTPRLLLLHFRWLLLYFFF